MFEKSNKLNVKAVIILGVFAIIFAMPNLIIALLNAKVFSFYLGKFIGSALGLFFVGWVIYRLIRGKYLPDNEGFAKKISKARFWAIIVMFVFVIAQFAQVMGR